MPSREISFAEKTPREVRKIQINRTPKAAPSNGKRAAVHSSVPRTAVQQGLSQHTATSRGRNGNGVPIDPHVLGSSFELMGVPMPFARNAEIYGETQSAEYLYKVGSGAVRTYRVLDDGRRQVIGFHFPGDTFGLEVGRFHLAAAEAVVNCIIVVIKRSAVLAAARRDTELAQRLWTVTDQELGRSQNHMMMLIKTAEERIAAFLLEMAERLPATHTFELPMSRQDIGDYLGLSMETVSRTLNQLAQKATIELQNNRRVVLRNPRALSRLNT